MNRILILLCMAIALAGCTKLEQPVQIPQIQTMTVGGSDLHFTEVCVNGFVYYGSCLGPYNNWTLGGVKMINGYTRSC